MSSTERDTIFISYSWNDELWRAEIAKQLQSIIVNSHRECEVWVDADKLRTGEHIDDSVKAAIERTKVAALLISPDFLTSPYIQKVELPLLKDPAIRRYPILVEPISIENIPWLNERLLLGGRDKHSNKLIALSTLRIDSDNRISGAARQILADAAGEIIETMDDRIGAHATTETHGASASEFDQSAASMERQAQEASPAAVESVTAIDGEQGAQPPQESGVDASEPVEASPSTDAESGEESPPEPSQDTYVEIELSLQHRDIHYYQAELRLTQSNDQNERHPHFLRLDTHALAEQAKNTQEYGRLLTDALFPRRGASADLILEKGLDQAKRLDVPLRFRICIAPTAMELHAVQWETLINPLSPTSAWLLDPAADGGRWPRIAFSRHALGSDQRWREVQLRSVPQGQARALVVVAAPSQASLNQLAEGRLAPIDRQQQGRRAEVNLKGMSVVCLPDTERATKEGLLQALADKDGWDLLYLVCHCTMEDDKATLILEDRKGDADPFAVRDLVELMGDLHKPPRGVIVVSGARHGGAGIHNSPERCGLMKAGPLLLQSGIILALLCDGDAPAEQLDTTLPRILEHLPNSRPGSDGRTDEALATARASIPAELHDDPWWCPVLVSRQKTTRIWYSPGFLKAERSKKNWTDLVAAIRQKQCTPVIGPGLVQHLVGSRREMAQSWADDHFFPMSYHDRINLPQVAQYLLVNHSDRGTGSPPPECERIEERMRNLCGELSNNLRSYLRARYPYHIPLESSKWHLSRVFSCAGREEIESNENEPHRVLAALELPLYVTANQNLLLEDAFCRHDPKLKATWKDLNTNKTNPFDYPQQVKDRIRHVFGDMNDVEHMVLTEDDYFEFLLSAGDDENRIPVPVRSRLSSTSLLFLGFRLYHWDFRVLFQFIKSLSGNALLQDLPHVAVQIDPDDDYIVDPERARRYLESYFADDSDDALGGAGKRGFNISIYWGTPVDFLRTLKEQLAASTDDEGSGSVEHQAQDAADADDAQSDEDDATTSRVQ